ncbi:hypothetical protein HMPREF1977_0966 [Capnocytophaga ochracea F0287]|uniref:Uncharacterized protein n=1 Tax=Capnocytophaga ochracea F0287 TaxID=873517 RepID=E4MRI2_CAPOC|nr:hypothetical protein HMPREF1977_0966 [Capnocytophaga ochracea F0287]EJF44182.1 hypothetical protein HMPREF1319_1307 [Capnocytophaga ochracea str. Holt 25]
MPVAQKLIKSVFSLVINHKFWCKDNIFYNTSIIPQIKRTFFTSKYLPLSSFLGLF